MAIEEQQIVLEEACKQFGLQVYSPLDSGAFKQAYLASLNGQSVALKIAHVTGELKSRFEREVSSLRQCNHKSIAKIIDSGSIDMDGNEYWVIVEEFLSLGTLSEVAKKSPLKLADLKGLGLAMSSALAHLYELKLVHRDIKPDNILYRSIEEPVLTDFGIVRMLDESSLTQDFMCQGPGTPMYASPEQLLNDKENIDWRTDQFCLALVLAEQILGKHAFSENRMSNINDAITSVVCRNEVPISNKNELEAKGFGCLAKALSPWPVQRFRKPASFIQAIQNVEV